MSKCLNLGWDLCQAGDCEDSVGKMCLSGVSFSIIKGIKGSVLDFW